MGAIRCTVVDRPGVREMEGINSVNGLTAEVSNMFIFSDGSLMSLRIHASMLNIEEIMKVSVVILLMIFLTSS